MSRNWHWFHINRARRKTIREILFKLYKECGSYYGVWKYIKDYDPTRKGLSITHIKRIINQRKPMEHKKSTKQSVRRSLAPYMFDKNTGKRY